MIRTNRWPFLKRGCATSILIAAMMLILAGCATQAPVPSDRYYRLQAVFSGEALVAPKFAGTFEIERFTADGLTAGRPIVYVEAGDPNQLREYNYHFWTQAPTIMLRDELVTYLRSAKVSVSIVVPEMRLDPAYVMTGRIRTLEQVLGSTNGTRLELEVAIRRIKDGKLLFLKSYAQETAQASPGVASAVDALNKSLNVIFSNLLQDLRTL